ncbi:Uncharacterised protein [Serratia grimesii]|nr:Uncharacterised protein [Serratia grimesii]
MWLGLRVNPLFIAIKKSRGCRGFDSVNKGKEKGNGTSHTETTVNAGNQVNITSGRNTNLIGAQATGESVKAEVGRNLLLESQQDSDRYDSKQQNGGGVRPDAFRVTAIIEGVPKTYTFIQ